MPNPTSFQQAVEQRLTQPAAEEKRYGFPIEQPHMKKRYDAFFKTRPDVAGMVVGGGLNDSDPDEPVAIISNPYSDDMKNQVKREALYKLEAARALMPENPVAEYPISENLQRLRKQYFKAGRDPYATDDKAFRETLISRMLVGDLPERLTTPEMQAERERYQKLLDSRK